MAINRYTQPVQAQYVPMDMQSYQQNAMMAAEAGKKPWNIIEAINARQQENYGKAQASMDQLGQGFAGLHAINDEDQKKLNEEAKKLRSEVENIYKKTDGKPLAMLPMLSSLNRQLKRNITSGDLYDIGKRYEIGMENIDEAKKMLRKGDIGKWSFNYQLKHPLAVIPNIGDPSSMAKDYLSKNYKDASFATDAGVKQNFFKTMATKYGDVYNSASDGQKAAMINEWDNLFKTYYRNEFGDNVFDENKPGMKQSLGTATKAYENEPIINKDKLTFSNDGQITGTQLSPKEEVIDSGINTLLYSYGVPGTIVKFFKDDMMSKDFSLGQIGDYMKAAIEAFGMATGDKKDIDKKVGQFVNTISDIQKDKNIVGEVKRLRKQYNIPEDLSDKEAVDLINNTHSYNSEKIDQEWKSATSSKNKTGGFRMFNEDGTIKDFSNAEISIDGVKSTNDEMMQTLHEAFGTDGDPTKLNKALAAMDNRFIFKKSTSKPGEVEMRFYDPKEEKTRKISVVLPDNTIQQSLGPAQEIALAKTSGKYNVPIPAKFPREIIRQNSEGKTEAVPYDSFIIKVQYPKDENGKIIGPGETIAVPMRNGEELYTYTNGKKTPLHINDDKLFRQGLTNVQRYNYRNGR